MRHHKRRRRPVPPAPHVCCRHTGEQRVRVTNWLGQVWVLLLAHAVMGMVGWRVWDMVGVCLWWNRCAPDYLWLGVAPWWLRGGTW